MRMTIDLPDPLFREAKAVAARQGTSLENFIRSAVELEIRKAQTKTVRRLKFPLLPSENAGKLKISNADIDDLLA